MRSGERPLIFGCALGLGMAVGAGMAEYAGPIGAWTAAVVVMLAAITWDFRIRRKARRAGGSTPNGPALTNCNQNAK